MIRMTDDHIVIDRRFSACLGQLKGPRLAVLLCLALHADAAGVSRVGLAQIAAETGHVLTAVSGAVKDLCGVSIDGQSAMTLLRPATRGRGRVNSYALFKEAADAHAGEGGEQ
jgi:hypothetical protein